MRNDEGHTFVWPLIGNALLNFRERTIMTHYRNQALSDVGCDAKLLHLGRHARGEPSQLAEVQAPQPDHNVHEGAHNQWWCASWPRAEREFGEGLWRGLLDAPEFEGHLQRLKLGMVVGRVRTSRKVGDDQTKRVTTEPLSLTLITWLPTKKFTKIGYPSRYRHFRWFHWLSGIFNNRDAARWSVRSVGDRVVPAFCCLILTLVAGGAQAQTAIDATDSKRVQVLQIKDGTATKEGAVKKPKSASAHKKKVAHRNNLSQLKAPTSEAAPPAQNDISTPAAEQTGTLAFGDRLVAFASSAGDDKDVDLSVANYVGTPGEPASVLAVGNAPLANIDAGQSPASQMPGWRLSTGGLATLSGAMVAAAFGWFLVRSSRRRISLSAGT